MKRPPEIDPDYLKLEFIVRREHAGWRADRFIAHRIPRLSRTRVQKILRRSAFDDKGKPIKPNRKLKEGERITIFRPPPVEPNVPRYFHVLMEDDYMVAVDKPAGLPVHPTARFHKNTLTALLLEKYGETRPVLAHRIDAETSGVVLCAKTRESERLLKKMFADHRIRKKYLALVRGVPDPPRGRIERPLGPDTEGPVRVKMMCRSDGLPSLTEYSVLKTVPGGAFVACIPRSGRQHQIRTHLAHMGHPILGDKMYGPDPDLFLDYLDQGMSRDIERRAGARRHLLHAASLSFTHPITEKIQLIESPLPEDMSAIVGRGALGQT